MNKYAKRIIFSAVLVTVLHVSCTKEYGFYQEDTIVGLEIKSTSMRKAFEVWLDEGLVQDSVSLMKPFARGVVAQEYRLRIAQSKTNAFFVDTTINLRWSAKNHAFSLIELDPVANPLFFAGFPDGIPAAADGFVTVGFLNLDITEVTKDNVVDLLIYDPGNPDKLLVAFDGIPYNRISPYFNVPVEVFNGGGFLVIEDTATQELIYDGRELWGFINLGQYVPGTTGNTMLLKLTNEGDTEYPFFMAETLFEGDR